MADIPMKRYDVLLFDLDDCLWPTTDNLEQIKAAAIEAIIAMIAAFGLLDQVYGRVNVQSVEELTTATRRLWDRIVQVDGSNDEHQLEKLVEDLGIYDAPANYQYPNKHIAAAGIVAYGKKRDQLYTPENLEEIRNAMNWLKSLGYVIGAVTSGDPTKQSEKLIRTNLDDLFIPHVWVVERRHRDKTHALERAMNYLIRPQGNLEQETKRSISKHPERIIYCGDKIDVDIASANALGLTSVWVRKGRYAGMDPSTLAGNRKPDYIVDRINQESLTEILNHPL